MVTPHELADFAALLCGILTATGVLGICAIFGLYALEDRLRRDDDVNNPSPAQRRDWFSSNYETWTPTDPDERADYLAELAHESEHGPGAGQEQSA